MTSLRLEDHGLQWEHAPAVLGHPFGDGQWALLHRDRDLTAAGLEELARRRRRRVARAVPHLGPHRGAAGRRAHLTLPAGARRSTAAAGARPRAGGLDTVRRLAHSRSPRSAASSSAGRPAPLLLAGNAGHADFPLDSPGSGVFGVLMTMLGQTVGFPVPRGGAAVAHRRARARGFTSLGGRARDRRAGHPRRRTRRARVAGVVTRDGECVRRPRAVRRRRRAHRASSASSSAQDDLPPRVVRGMRDFELDPGTVKVDWALTGPVPWAGTPGARRRAPCTSPTRSRR